MVSDPRPLGPVEVGLSAFAMGVNVLEDRFDASTLPVVHVPLMVIVPTLFTCFSEPAVEGTAVLADWTARGCETETVLVVTALPTGIPLEIIVAAREVSSLIGSERSLLEELIGRIGRLIGVMVTEELPPDGVSTFNLAVGFSRLRESCGPPTWLDDVLFLIAAGDTEELLALLTAAGGTFLLVFDAFDFSGLLTLANLPPYPLGFSFARTDFPRTSGGGKGICLTSTFEECLLLLCFFCPLLLQDDLPN